MLNVGATVHTIYRYITTHHLCDFHKIVIHVGSNDMLTKEGRIKDSPRHIIIKIHRLLAVTASRIPLSSSVIYSSILPALPGKYVPPDRHRRRNRICQQIQQSVAECGYKAIGHQNFWFSSRTANPNLFVPDGIHTNSQGATLFANNFITGH